MDLGVILEGLGRSWRDLGRILEGLGTTWGGGLGIAWVPRRRPARSWRVWAELAAGREEVSLLVPFWSRFWTTAGCVLAILCRVSKMPRDGGGSWRDLAGASF